MGSKLSSTFEGSTPRTSTVSSSIDEGTEELWPYVWAIRDPECLDWKIGLTREEIQNLALLQLELTVSIIPILYLSDHKHVCDVEKLKSIGITHVLNVAGPAARGPLQLYEIHNIT
jgi:hypothetical protein